jgi:hypothetical protein
MLLPAMSPHLLRPETITPAPPDGLPRPDAPAEDGRLWS